MFFAFFISWLLILIIQTSGSVLVQELNQVFCFNRYFIYHLRGNREVNKHKNNFWTIVWSLLPVTIKSLWNLLKPVMDFFYTVLDETGSDPDRKICQYVFECYFKTSHTSRLKLMKIILSNLKRQGKMCITLINL